MDLRELIEISRFYGTGNEFTIAGGGNTSVKDRQTIAIKASGVGLRDITESGFVELSRAAVRAILDRKHSEDPFKREEEIKRELLACRMDPESGGRPSVETSLHEMIDYRFVVHTHASTVNALLCSQQSLDQAKALFADALLIPYTDPGYRLAVLMHRELTAYRKARGADPHVILMQNHGLVVAAETVAEIRERTDDVLSRIRSRFKGALPSAEPRPLPPAVARLAPVLRMMLSEPGALKIAVARSSALIEHFLKPENRKKVSLPFMPDDIVYCKSAPLYLEGDAAEAPEKAAEVLPGLLAKYREKWGYAPRVIMAPGVGVLAVDDNKKSADICLEVFENLLRVSYLAESFGGPRFLTPRDIEFIETWEVESYRRNVARGAGPKGKIEGRIALVTGAAQGFGRGIAEGLMKAGANVVAADLNEQGGQALAAELNAWAVSSRASQRALFVRADVTDPESLRALAAHCAAAFGGLDLLVCNAGVLRAGGLEEMSLESFDFVTRVNYTGYFLCVKELSPLMVLQRRHRPEHTTDIIQINSKSGLQGSNRNFAYAGGKFGGIGLTQSFALELVEHGIKVNSICPGNFFEGPLWSDPEKGLFVQYLRAGKVPGAKTVADVRHHYESRVPMGRGCRVEDVMRAILYLVEQEYETGQALPVTGGQVMLG